METIQCKEEKKSLALTKEGYAIFKLLSKDQITQLTNIFYSYHTEEPDGFYATTHIEDKALRKKLSNHIIEIVASEILKLFENMQILGGAFIAKAPGDKGILPLHQDWNIVNEQKARSYNLWIPLVDVTSHNGAMKILPESHQKQENYRGPGIPSLFRNISEVVEEHMSVLNMDAGEALLYDHALWHSSPKNNSNKTRLCIVLGAVPKNTALKYYAPKENRIAEFNSYADFFFDHDSENGSNYLEFNTYVAHDSTPITAETFFTKYLGRPPSIKKKKWFNLFSKNTL